ncbi:hypothetical protein CP520_01370 [Mesoplasma lactucae ATCC 49193]|uniref:Uncharacterized protein n=2 Tax=Mesoplasma lactucae TaxID=138853 RepID=A0A291IRT9_9MOLU|nr:hypothetical protein CP520_01370 [Mesoplasma lactucae ATCC 49193]
MKKPTVKFEDGKYVLNKYQSFYVDEDAVEQDLLREIKFPVLIMDTEFFNRSHDPKPNDSGKKLYSDDEPSMIYTLCYSIANSYMDLANRKNKKSISTLYVRRKMNKADFNFKKEMDRMLTTFVNICIAKNIRTLVFAGESNDVKILTNWINNHSNLLNNKKQELFTRNKQTRQLEINTFDIYKTLEKGFSFSDFTTEGEEFYNPKNLKKGIMGENTIQIPSLKLFFDYFKEYYKDKFEEKNGIYELCKDALTFYSTDSFASEKQFQEGIEVIREVRKHCRNDVLKLLYLINFMYVFGVLSNDQAKESGNNKNYEKILHWVW